MENMSFNRPGPQFKLVPAAEMAPIPGTTLYPSQTLSTVPQRAADYPGPGKPPAVTATATAAAAVTVRA